MSYDVSIILVTCKRKQEIDPGCVLLGGHCHPIMKLSFTIYSKDAVFSLDNDHMTVF